LNASTRRFEIEGRSLGFPALFQDASSAVGLFAVPSKAANALIRESGFEVAEIWPGRAIFSLSCVHYRESDCGAYNEIAMGFFVKKQAQAPGIPYLGTWLDILRDRAATWACRRPSRRSTSSSGASAPPLRSAWRIARSSVTRFAPWARYSGLAAHRRSTPSTRGPRT
jgi:hypothetical protein